MPVPLFAPRRAPAAASAGGPADLPAPGAAALPDKPASPAKRFHGYTREAAALTMVPSVYEEAALACKPCGTPREKPRNRRHPSATSRARPLLPPFRVTQMGKREDLLAKAQLPSKQALRLHPFYRGKVQTIAKCPIRGLEDFAIWYTPGVAAPCRAIAANPELARAITEAGPDGPPGDAVEAGQVVCVLEAMKMKNPIRISFSGVVAAVPATAGQNVAYGDVLVRLA